MAMIELLTLDRFSEDEHQSTDAIFCKHYQRLQMKSLCAEYHGFANFCEIGCHDSFGILIAFPGPKYIVDPYFRGGGAGLDTVPSSLPYPIGLFRCALGLDSDLIPSNLFDFCFSVSVIEHIGQAEVGYDCQPTDSPPPEQEGPRDAFCGELFRVMRPGGVTIHSVDHAPRNRSYVSNFQNAGFKLLVDEPMPALETLLDAPDAVRQRCAWLDPLTAMTPDEQRLHSVLTFGFRKPT